MSSMRICAAMRRSLVDLPSYACAFSYDPARFTLHRRALRFVCDPESERANVALTRRACSPAASPALLGMIVSIAMHRNGTRPGKGE